MPKLYYTATSCGAASFIAAVAAKVTFDSEQVSLMDHKTSSGVDFYSINPKGNVPTLVLDDGTVLNEGAATLQYIADQVCFDSNTTSYIERETFICHYILLFNVRPQELLLP